ncbi:MAG TPA: helix-turn-helix domain-containing protein [Ilumatobacter sp.]|nr:helix-turn-helix domain-containing protein [Ilumatobacter sp.]
MALHDDLAETDFNIEHDDPVEDGWTPVPGVGEPVERFELDDLDLLGHLTHPVRGALLRRLKEPRTVAQLAAALDAPVTRLYHHVNKLEQLGLIRVVATRQVAAVTERRYQASGRSFRIARSLFETADDRELSIALGSLFDVAKHGFQRTVESGGYRDLDHLEDQSTVSLGDLALSPERRSDLVHRLSELVEEFRSDRDLDDPAAEHVTLFVAVYPNVG